MGRIRPGISYFRGQSAIEYLMTYGWMFLILVLIGVVIFAFAQDDTPDTQSGFTGANVQIVDFGITTEDKLDLVLRNGGSEGVDVGEITVTDQDSGILVWKGSREIDVGNEESIEVGEARRTDEGNSYDVEITYDVGGLENIKVSGTISGRFTIDGKEQWELVNQWEAEDSIAHSAFSDEKMTFGGFDFQDRDVYKKGVWDVENSWEGSGALAQADFSDDGEYLAVKTSQLKIHDTSNWETIVEGSFGGDFEVPQGDSISFLHGSDDFIYEDTNDGNYPNDGLVLIENLNPDEDKFLTQADTPNRGGLTTSEEFVVFADGGTTGGDEVRVWNASDVKDQDNNREVQILDNGGEGFNEAQTVSLSKESEYLAVAESHEEGSVYIYEWDNGEKEFELEEEFDDLDFPNPAVFSKTEASPNFLAYDEDDSVVIREVGTWDEVTRLEEAGSIVTIAFGDEYMGYGGHNNEYFVHIYDPDIYE